MVLLSTRWGANRNFKLKNKHNYIKVEIHFPYKTLRKEFRNILYTIIFIIIMKTCIYLSMYLFNKIIA